MGGRCPMVIEDPVGMLQMLRMLRLLATHSARCPGASMSCFSMASVVCEIGIGVYPSPKRVEATDGAGKRRAGRR